MGKLLGKYKEEYKAAIAPGIANGDCYVVKQEIWINSKWEDDMKLDGPWQPEYADALMKVASEDEELLQVLLAGIEMKKAAIGMMAEEKSETREPQCGAIWDEDTERYI